MKLWIRSQDREKIVKCNDIAIQKFLYNEIPKDECCYTIFGYFDKETEYEKLGIYKTKERALEVLDEIQERITILNLMSIINNENEMIKVANALGENKIDGVLKPYQMPKE